MAVGDELSVYVDLLKQGRTSLRLRAEAVGRQRDSDLETVVAEGEFTFVALDADNKPREIAAEEPAMADQYDLIVLGSGPGGYVAAIRAAQLGLKTAIVEREKLGGICLNWGCIPTKALLRTAEVFHYMTHADAYGLSNEKPSFDLAKVVARSRAVAKQLNQGVTHLMKKNKIAVVMGEGKLTGKGKLSVAGADGKTTELSAKHIIVATGARARDLPFAKADGKRIWTYRHAMTPAEMPSELLVIGSGAIGIEFASFYADLGAKVTVVEMLDRLVPVEDAEVSAQLEKSLHQAGADDPHVCGSREPGFRRQGRHGQDQDQGWQESPNSASAMPSSRSASRPTPRISGSRLWASKPPRGISTPTRCAAPTCRASGRSATSPRRRGWRTRRATKASPPPRRSPGNWATRTRIRIATDPLNIPGCTYCRPQVASVGLTEAKAKENRLRGPVGKFPAIGNGKAIALGEVEGFVKTVFDAKTGELLGAHMIGAEVTELIQGYTIGKTAELVETDFIETVFPHPTLSEMMHESVLAAFGRVIHI